MAFALSARDVQAFAEWQRKRLRSVWSSLLSLLLLGALAVLIGLAVATSVPAAVASAITFVGAIVVATPLTKRRQRGTLDRHALLASGTVTVDETHVRFDSTFGTSTYGWEYFNNVVDTSNHVFLMGCKTCCIILPRQAFPNRQETGAFVDFVEAHLRGATRWRPRYQSVGSMWKVNILSASMRA